MLGIQANIPEFTSYPTTGVTHINCGAHCIQQAWQQRPDSTLTDANRNWQMATGKINTHSAVTHSVQVAESTGCVRLVSKTSSSIFSVLRTQACTFRT